MQHKTVPPSLADPSPEFGTSRLASSGSGPVDGDLEFAGMLGLPHRIANSGALRRALNWVAFPAFLVFLWVLARDATPAKAAVGFVVSMFGEAIQLWCFGCLQKQKHIALCGPYRLVRNPMYLGRYLVLLGFALVPGNWVVPAIYSVLYYFYMVNRVRREEVQLGRIFGAAYDRYCRLVNRFVPRWRRVALAQIAVFRWSTFVRNNGHWNLAAVAIAWLCVGAGVLFG